MKKFAMLVVLVFIMAVTVLPVAAESNEANDNACWGQASAVFAGMGEMGEHARQQPTPRMGLHNLAVALYEQGVIGEASLQALGAFVAAELGLSIDACME